MKGQLPILATACCAFTLFACTEVTFPEPQPKGIPALMQVPPSIRGQYLLGHPLGEPARAVPPIPEKWDQGLAVIAPWGFCFYDFFENTWERRVVSDSLVIKYYQEYFFVNIKLADDLWALKLLKPAASGSFDFLMIDVITDEQDTTIITRLSKSIEVKTEKSDYDTFYNIDPSRDQLMSLISMGFFAENEHFRFIKKK